MTLNCSTFDVWMECWASGVSDRNALFLILVTTFMCASQNLH